MPKWPRPEYKIGQLDLRKINQPIIHKDEKDYRVASKKLKYLIKNNINDNKFKKPDDLIIVLVSNYKDKGIFEKSLEHIGIFDYVVLNDTNYEGWKHMYKIIWIYNYLKNNNFKEKYLLYVDARDAIIQDDPQKIINLLLDYNCKLLFSVTEFDGYYSTSNNNDWNKDVKKLLNMKSGKKYIQENQKIFYDYCIKEKSNGFKLFLNAGCFIGELEYIKNFFGFILEDKEKNNNVFINKYEDDQTLITNYLPLFPDIKLDIYFKMAWRNTYIYPNTPNNWIPLHEPPYKENKDNKNK